MIHLKRILALTIFLLFLLTGCSTTETDRNSNNSDSNSALEPTYYYNPLTGEKDTDKLVLFRRPLSVMINNIKIALPQFGIGSADICYEMVTEGGITRVMAIFSDYTKMPKVGPTRSARHPFIQFASSYDLIYTHFGGSTYAYNLLSQMGVDSIDGMAYSEIAYITDPVLAQTKGLEHSRFTSGELIQNAIERKGLETFFTEAQSPAFQFNKEDTPIVFSAPEGETAPYC